MSRDASDKQHGSDLSKPDKGAGLGALQDRGETHVVAQQQLVDGLHLKLAAVATNISKVDALKVPDLQE